MAKAKDMSELRDHLLEMFDSVIKDPRRANQADVAANVAGKIINTVGVQLEYASLRGELPEIPFLGPTSGLGIKTRLKLLDQNTA